MSSDSKLKGFNIGSSKPGRVLQRKIENENKKKVFQEFVATFEGNSKDRMWVKGGLAKEGHDSSEKRLYIPKSKIEQKTKVEPRIEIKSKEKPALGKRKAQEQKKSMLEQFKEELKLKDGYPYDFDDDHTTTNLFLGNLNPKMTEQQLCEVFGRYGPLASVKVMWPRTEEEHSRGRNCGFVAFMNRGDGERALENIKGKELMGFEMKLGWGKNVPIPLYPVYIPPALIELIKPPSPSGLPFNAQPREWLKSMRLVIKERAKMVTDGAESDAPLPPGLERKPFDVRQMSDDELNQVLKDAVVKVVVPTDRSVLAQIHRTIEFVVLEGPRFEAAIMNREQNNPQFRAKVLALGGQKSSVCMSRVPGGGLLQLIYSQLECPRSLSRPTTILTHKTISPIHKGSAQIMATHDATALSRRCGLTEAQRGRFTAMLGDLEPSRTGVGDLMIWCLEHADSAADLTSCIVDSMAAAAVESPPSISRLLARLYLVSDILYNSSAKVPNASFFRKCFESSLPDFFKNLNQFYTKIQNKPKAEQLKVDQSNNDIAGIPLEQPKSSIQLDSNVELLQGQPLVQYDGDPLDVDGSPLNDDQPDSPDSSPPVVKPSHKPTTPVSSVPTSSSSRLFVPSKWETVDPDLVESQAVTTSSRWELLVDDAPGATISPSSRSQRPPGTAAASQAKPWSSILEASDELDGEPLATNTIGLVAYDDEDAASPMSNDDDLASVPLPPVKATPDVSESRRAQLREVELKVLRYQDELESARKDDKSITEEALGRQVNRYRQRLLDRINSDETSDKSSKAKSSRSTSSSKPKPSTNRRRTSQTPPPSTRRDSRDRSPPRSFRGDRNDRPRPSPSSGDDQSPDLSSYELTNPATRAKHRRRGDDDDETVEDGEISSPGRKHRKVFDSPKSAKKRQRSPSPPRSSKSSRRQRASKSPSPSRSRRRPDSRSRHK